ncbi:hypothetical protein C7T94_01215 [Pedobacter yulinensis]|uniref:Tetratricopeptide repeat protein n=2 Tax=Pedobacter yulinensis TaxID=2126353 RepID=A0A2T3HQP0_9SPHI|nr:hypothetical protein C7T94_01215 [Pedobacter yulinensis]
MYTELKDLLNNPQAVTASHAELLRGAVSTYPYFQPLYVLLAIAEKEGAALSANGTYTKSGTRASVFTHGHLVYAALQHPEELQFKKFAFSNTAITTVQAPEETTESERAAAADTANAAPSRPAPEEEPEDEVYEEIGELQTLPLVPVSGPVLNIENLAPEDIPDNPISAHGYPRTDAPGPDREQAEEHAPATAEKETPPPAVPLPESVASFDFFAFDARFPATTVAEQAPETTAEPTDDGRVSKYHDDALPYTFLWWLAKTRKEYESFRPYANPVKRSGPPPEPGLQQQYVEHIFHIQTPFEAEDLVGDNETEARQGKEAELIDKFIRQQPQINAPEPEKIDTENKAKKSAEDQYDLVTETLAKIYIEQMLYHKAIDTYKKLSLKYPEKSRYFADLIQSIEKKI